MKKAILIWLLLFHSIAYSNGSPIIISLGSDCHVATELRVHNLRNRAFPFDWNVTPLEGLFHVLEDDFAHFLDENYLIMRDDLNGVLNTYYGIDFRHDFPNRNPLVPPEKQIEYYEPCEMPEYKIYENFLDFIGPVREKYNRRIQRFRDVVNGNNQVVFIRHGDISKEQTVKLHSLIRSKFPNLDFILVVCGQTDEMRTDWGYRGIRNFYARYVFEDWGKIFKSLKLLTE